MSFYLISYSLRPRHRIIEVEWAVTHGTDFQPSPRRRRTKRRSRRATQGKAGRSALNTVPELPTNGDESNEEEVVVSLLGGNATDHRPWRGGAMVAATFGREVTNSPKKRDPGVAAYANGAGGRNSPKKARRGETLIDGMCDAGEDRA
jgi:hypothetical protein